MSELLDKEYAKPPKSTSSILGYVHFSFIWDTLRRARSLGQQNKPITSSDLPDLDPYDKAENLENKFTYYFKNQKFKSKNLNLAIAILRTYKKVFSITIFAETMLLVCRIASVWMAMKLLQALSDPNANQSDEFIWAGILCALIFFGTYFMDHQFHLATVTPVKIRAGLISMIYNKITRLSLYSVNKISLGKIVNIVANDVNIFERTAMYFTSLCVAIISIIMGGAVLWIMLGPSCLVGIAYVIIGYPIQQTLNGMSAGPRNQKNSVTDERVKVTNEVIEGIRLLKMYTWELIFKDKINQIRHKENSFLKRVFVYEAVSRGVAFTSQAISSFLMFLVYALMGGELTVAIIFPSLYLIGFLRIRSVLFVALASGFLTDIKLLFPKIIMILEAPEVEEKKFLRPIDPNNVAELENFTAYWTKPEEHEGEEETKKLLQDEEEENKIQPAIKDITVNIRRGSLNALIGKVGSGKSSFLLSFTGEMPKTEGTMRFNGSIAYVEQEPTIFSGTLRENILFGKDYDAHFYQKVVDACCLESDLALFPKGDLTEIGEKGVNLSGGQKARLALARAIYSNADVYLLDDPLSAVDTKVAKKLYQDAITGMLSKKTVILVTHQVHFVKAFENIIAMEDGKIVGSGTLTDLFMHGVDVKTIFDSMRKLSRKVSDAHSRRGSQMALTPQKPSPLKPGLGVMDPRRGSFFSPEFKIEPRKDTESDMDVNSQVSDEEHESEISESRVIIDEEKGKLFAPEDPKSGQVSFSTYTNLLSHMAGKPILLIALLIFVITEVGNVAFGRVLGEWGAGGLDQSTALLFTGCLAAFIFVISCVKYMVFNFLLARGSNKLHDEMSEHLVRSPVEFFDTNPVGRILNRFSNDLGNMDKFLPMFSLDTVDFGFFCLGMLVTIIIINPLALIPILLASIAIYFLLIYCYDGLTKTRTYDLTSRSPLYSLFSSTLSGLLVIRSYGQAENFDRKFKKVLDDNTKGSAASLSCSAFFSFCVNLFYTLASMVSVFIVTAKHNDNAALSGLSLCFILAIIGALGYALRQAVQTNVLMSSVARVQAYCELPSEAEVVLPSDDKYRGRRWPAEGKIDFSNVFMKYRNNTEHVIKDLSLQIRPGEKIGCVGRTGAGKSSFLQILFRMIEIDRTEDNKDTSYVKIDDVDTQDLGLHLLRNNISIIPQTPFVFSGDVRKNLDPLGVHTDQELWQVLEDVDLKDHVEKLPGRLHSVMENASSVFSVGQKQLVCLARAILKKTKILVLDEATANVDLQTDHFIQQTIMEKFEHATIFTIAHRLSTVAAYDKILVLDQGKKIEYDEPYKLLVNRLGDEHITNKTGHFASMVLNTGPRTSQQIFELAKNKHLKDLRKEL